jgi:putative iron-regulated protein
MRRARGSWHAKGGGVLLFAASICLLACDARRSTGAQPRALDAALTGAALRTYADVAHAVYADSASAARVLLARLDALLAQPSETTLAAARAAWLAAREPYAQSEVFRFYDGPIDAVELWVNTWPIDEAYVESPPGESTLGIVQDVERYPELSAALLRELNGQGGETAISTGYHVIEFLLWGRDDDPDGPGRRPASDFAPGAAGKRAGAAELARRRGKYLRLAAELLIAQLEQVRDAWRPGDPHNYRAQFLAPPAQRGLYLALKGMAKLSGPELAGERLTVAYETKDQENEHSCFSDSTHADIVGDALGVENVCTGRYRRLDGRLVSGTGVCAAVSRAAPELGAQLAAQIAVSLARAREIPAPFDQAIVGDDAAPGRAAIERAARALRAQAESCERVRAALSLAEPLAASVAP